MRAGSFLQTYQTKEYAAAGLDRVFVQDNLSRSCRDTVRGLHYQLRHPQAKLVSVLRGAVLDVAVDIRRGSPTFGRSVAVELSEDNRKQLLHSGRVRPRVPRVERYRRFLLQVHRLLRPGDEYGVSWNDPDLGIPWGDLSSPVVSPKDMQMPRLADVPPEHLPKYKG